MQRLFTKSSFRLNLSLLLAGLGSPVFAQQPPQAADPSYAQAGGQAGYDPSAAQSNRPVWSEAPPVGPNIYAQNRPGLNPGANAGPNGGQVPPDVAGPPVGRISFVGGDVSVRHGASSDAIAAAQNAPVVAGDIVATAPGARAEIEFDPANRFRLGTEAEARVADMQSGHIHVEIAHGTASWSVVGDNGAQAEISTPNVSVRPLSRGLYRFWVRDDGQSVITVRHGSVDVFTTKGSERVSEGQTMFVRGSAQDPEFQVVEATGPDEWDNWNEQRDQSFEHSQSYRYVNPDMTGAEDLDGAGNWVNDPTYGQVWAPQEPDGWAPYQDGRWAWEDYYGWTWIGAEPWGWAPYHYGSWFRGPVGWCWYPGSVYRPVFWRPALVAFFGFGRFGVGVGFGGWGNIGWLPLAPFEAFVPWYGRGFGAGWHGGGVRLANVNIYNNYRNARVAGAISGVSAANFSAGRFNGAITHVGAGELRQAGLVRGAMPISPTANNMRYTSRSTSLNPRMSSSSHFYSTASAARPANTAMRSSSFAGASTSPGWNRFGTASRTGATQSSNWGRFGATAPSAQRAGGGQSLRISPPIVHQRSDSGPYNSSSYGASRAYSPSYGSPYSRPNTSAPAYSRPSYSGSRYATPSGASNTQHYSSGSANSGRAPAPRSSSSGGGHASSGGHAGGGGGHRR